MPDKKSPEKADTAPVVDPELEHRVDEMMSVEPEPAMPEVASAPELKIQGVADIDDEVDEQPVPEEKKPLKPEKSTAKAKKSESEVLQADPDEDPTLDPIVDDIVANESDELLARRDASAAAAGMIIPKPSFGERFKRFMKAWWGNKVPRTITLMALGAILVALGAIPATRYAALNLAGVRVSASLTVVDNTTELPLKNVSVEMGGQQGKTNENGLVRLNNLKLGKQELQATQPGFAPVKDTLTLGWGSNPLGDYKLRAVGTQFRVTAMDYLSGKPVTEATIESDESNAKADNKGLLVLTVAPHETSTVTASVSAEDYRTEKLKLEPGKNLTVQMVPDHKHVFVSKQSGKYDLYKIDIDGKNKQLLLPATGLEDAELAVAQSPDGKEAALVSRRDTTKDQDGYVLETLTMINVSTGDTLSLDKSERFQIVDWIGDQVIYVRTKAAASAGAADRYQLISYNYDTNARVQLASANYFTGVVSSGGTLYYAASNNFQGGTSLFGQVRPDLTGKQTILNKTDIWSLSRTSYDSLTLTSNQIAYTYKLGDKTAVKANNANTSENRFYLDSPDGKNAAWVDNRDGKGVLIVTDIDKNKDTVVKSDSGLSMPISWLNAHTLVYRVTRNGETADYAVSIGGCDAKKISDVTATAGFGWNY